MQNEDSTAADGCDSNNISSHRNRQGDCNHKLCNRRCNNLLHHRRIRPNIIQYEIHRCIYIDIICDGESDCNKTVQV